MTTPTARFVGIPHLTGKLFLVNKNNHIFDNDDTDNQDNQHYPRGGATSYADIDNGSMEEFRRFAEEQY